MEGRLPKRPCCWFEPIKFKQLTGGMIGARGGKIASMTGKQGMTNRIVILEEGEEKNLEGWKKRDLGLRIGRERERGWEFLLSWGVIVSHPSSQVRQPEYYSSGVVPSPGGGLPSSRWNWSGQAVRRLIFLPRGRGVAGCGSEAQTRVNKGRSGQPEGGAASWPCRSAAKFPFQKGPEQDLKEQRDPGSGWARVGPSNLIQG